MAKDEKKTADDEEGRPPPPEAAPSSTASSSSPPSVWGSIGTRALEIAAVVFLLIVIALGVALPLALLGKNKKQEESGSSARQTAALEMELQGITYEQPVDEGILESV